MLQYKTHLFSHVAERACCLLPWSETLNRLAVRSALGRWCRASNEGVKSWKGGLEGGARKLPGNQRNPHIFIPCKIFLLPHMLANLTRGHIQLRIISLCKGVRAKIIATSKRMLCAGICTSHYADDLAPIGHVLKYMTFTRTNREVQTMCRCTSAGTQPPPGVCKRHLPRLLLIPGCHHAYAGLFINICSVCLQFRWSWLCLNHTTPKHPLTDFVVFCFNDSAHALNSLTALLSSRNVGQIYYYTCMLHVLQKSDTLSRHISATRHHVNHSIAQDC